MRRSHVVVGIGFSVGAAALLLTGSRLELLEQFLDRTRASVERSIDGDADDPEEREREERERMGPGGRPLPGEDHPGEAMRFRNLSLQDENGNIPSDGLVRGKAHVQQMFAVALPTVEPIAGISRSTWTWLGPGNIGGRVRALAIHPTTSTTMFAGSVGGGIWKSTNAGGSWAPVDDFLADLAVSSIVFDPLSPSTMYAGTGEGFYNADGIRGAGIFKSTDNGTTWTQLAATNNASFYYVNRLAISSNGAVILAATRSGIFRSTNGGSSWNLQSATESTDIDFNPLDSTKAVASGYNGNALYSNDGGVTWFGATGLPAASFRRVEIAYAPSAPSIVYASVDVNRGSIYISFNGGATYAFVSNPPQQYLGGQGWYDNALWVNPFDSSSIVVGGIDLYKSTNGGASLSKISAWQGAPASAHADNHVIVSPPDFNNGGNKTLYIGNDGGVYRAADWSTVGGGGTADCPSTCAFGWTSLNNNLGVTQFYGGAGHVGTGRILGGTQDNGTLIYNGNAQSWTTEFGGDGGFAGIDPTNANVLYGEYVYLALHRSLSGSSAGADWINGMFWNGSSYVCKPPPYYIPDVCTTGGILGQANFIAPFILDPNSPNRLLAGGLSLWRTNDAATPNTPSTGPSWASIKSPTTGSSPISAIGVATGNSDVIWVGHNNGDVWRTTNGTAVSPTWSRMDNGSLSLPNRMITRITVDPNNSNIVYVTFGGFATDNIYRSIDGGFNWSILTGAGATSLPAVPVRDVKVFSGNSSWLYAATDLGVFTSIDGGANWGPPTSSPTDGPANVAVDELFFMGSTTLVAVTHGRGMFKTDIAIMTAALTANKTAPQPINTTVTFTATSTGGTAPESYKFVLTSNNWVTYTVVRDWSTTNTWSWTPTLADANYRVGVWVRSAGVSTDAPQAAASIPYAITGPAPPSSLVLSADKTAPQPTNTTVTFTAAPTGGVEPISYKFLLTSNNWATYSVVQDWSTTNTWTWTPTVADANYRVGVWARSAGVSGDAPQAATSIAFAITGPGPVGDVGLTADKTSPQPINTTITFTATPTGGTAPVSYKFLLTNNNWASYTVVRDWSTTNTWAWTPTVADANYRIGVWARSDGVSTDAPQAAFSIPFAITGPGPVAGVALTADKTSPQATNTTITFTATPTGGTAPISYKFLLTNNNWTTYAVVQDWSTTNTWAWTPTVADANYRVGVWARSAGVSTDAPQAAFSIPFAITGPGPVASVTLNADKAAPQTINTPITFTATPTGGTAPVSYKFLLTTNNWTTYTVVQDWSTTNTWAWTPTVADVNYRVGVWARSAGVSTDAPQAAFSIPFAITGPGPVASVTLNADKAAPQTINTTITFTATPTGGTAPVSYKFLLTTNNWTTYTVVQDWSPTNTWTWTPGVADANYRVGVWARSAGVTADAPDAAFSIPFAITP